MGDLMVEDIFGADVGAPLDHEDARAVRKLGDTDVDLVFSLLTGRICGTKETVVSGPGDRGLPHEEQKFASTGLR